MDINPDPRANLIVCGLRIGAKRMKQLFAIVLSTAAICAFASATPAAAQVAADRVDMQDQTPYMQQSDRTQAYTAGSADPANKGCNVIEESRAESGHSQHTVVCPLIP
jgi:hypothetical protein